MEPNSPHNEEDRLDPIQEEGTRTPDDHVVGDPPPLGRMGVDPPPHEARGTCLLYTSPSPRDRSLS
eukprot:620680-Pyramimonas_sp.AAC.1